jgi:repressor LexA
MTDTRLLPDPVPEKQQADLDFIADHLREHGTPPTLREIADAAGNKSETAVRRRLRALERRNLIVLPVGTKRGIRLVASPGCPCPTCGRPMPKGTMAKVDEA